MNKRIFLVLWIITAIFLIPTILSHPPSITSDGIVSYSNSASLLDINIGAKTSSSLHTNDLHWDDSFTLTGGISGNPRVNAFASDENGNLFVAGTFTNAGGGFTSNIAKWDGQNWSPLGSGTNGPVMDVLYDGNGNLYAAGGFSVAGGVPVNNIAKWNGQSWSSLGSGTNNTVNTLVIDSTGNLYAGGWFTTTDGIPTNGIAKWDGANWSGLGEGVNGIVIDLAFGETGNLFVGGDFTAAGTGNANNVAQWDGNSWSNLGNGTNAAVRSLTVGSDGNLFAGGDFTHAGNVDANFIASWNGNHWTALGSGLNNQVNSIIHDGNGNIYVGGDFTTADGINSYRIAQWDGSNWSALSSGMDNSVYALHFYDGKFVAGGIFNISGDINARCIAIWDNEHWRALENGVDNYINDFERDGLGNIYSGGAFGFAGGGTANRIANWIGWGWSSLGSGVNTTVHGLAIDAIGDLYVGGSFTMAGDVIVNYIARWNGSNWSPLGSGMNNSVLALAVDGENNLIAGGLFSTAGGIQTSGIARWNGNQWEPLGSGLNGIVGAIAIAQNGDVYVGGDFSVAGGIPANNIARWDGNNWSSLGSGMNHIVNSIVLVGNDLYAGGFFTTAGGIATNYIARWDGTSWSGLDNGMNAEVHTVEVNNIGNLIAGGDFTMAGGTEANHIAIWDGTSWSALGSGMNDDVYALEVGEFDFYAGGQFTTAGNKPSYHIARWNNSTPIAIGDNYNTNEDVPISIPAPGVLSNDSDPEDDTLTAILINEPSHGILSLNPDGSFNYTPDQDYNGSDYFIYAASDKFLSDSVTVTLITNPVNDPPVLDPIGDKVGDEETLLEFTATANDYDTPPQGLTFSLDPGAPSGSVITLDGNFSWTPSEQQGPGIYPVTIRVTDDGMPPLSDFEIIDIQVNEVNLAPAIDPIEDISIDEGNLLIFTASATDEDIPANNLIFSLDSGFPDGAGITPEGIFTWIPDEIQGPGNYELTIRVTDDGVPPQSDFDSFLIMVNETNQSPIAVDDFYFAIEDTPLEVLSPGVMTNDIDEDIPPNPLSAVVVNNPTHGLLNLNQDGSFTYIPETNYLGMDGFSYFINDGQTNSNIATATISVTIENVAPIVYAGDDMSGFEGSEISFTGIFTDPDSLSLSASDKQIRWDFDDGYQITGTLTPTHKFSDNSEYQVILTITDTLGAVGMDTVIVSILNILPLIEELPDQTIHIGEDFTLSAHFTDPSDLDTHTGIINWGDGIEESLEIDQEAKTIIANHMYLQVGVYQVSITIIDDDGGQSQTYFQLLVLSDYHHYLPLVRKR